MQQQLRGDGTKSRTSRSSRSSSVGSDAIPAAIVSSLITVPAAKPLPAYVAAAAASELVTNSHHLALHEDSYDLASASSPDNHEGAIFSTGGLAMINAFLDQLLFNFLVHSRGTTLVALRQSVEQILKGKLAAYAIASADEELEELLNDDELDENLTAMQESASGSTKGDIEAIFWRTRLRVMVYMRLGELEDEDEERYVEEAQAVLHKDPARKRLSLNTGLVSWAAAIFLTSILEFIAEQCLSVAGQAAFDRSMLRRRSKGQVDSEEEERVTVEEYDTEKVALSSTLGRLWRTWRKGLRSPHLRNGSASKSYPNSRKHSTSSIRTELLGRQHIDNRLKNAGEKDLESNNASRAVNVDGGALSKNGIVSAAIDEGARINAVRIYRISQRPRSLIVVPIKRADQNRASRDMFVYGTQQQGFVRHIRSRSLPDPGRATLISAEDSPVPGSDRPSTAPKFAQNVLHEPDSETLLLQAKSDLHAVSSLELIESDVYGSCESPFATESRSLDQSYALSEKEEQSFHDRAISNREPVPIRQDSRSQSSEIGQADFTAQTSVGSTESFTSIDEDLESQEATSSGTAEMPRNVPNGLGIHSTARAISPVAEYYEPPPRSARSGPYSPPYNEQQAVGSTKSNDREEKSSVRRLSNSSSKDSKSNSSATHPYSTKPSLETLSSPPPAATGRSGYFEKGFGDIVAGEETVKYTLTPRTLQEIESPDSPRYKEKDIAWNKDHSRKQNIPDSELAKAQKAVIASMNASLRTYTPSNDSRRVVASAGSTPPVPPMPKSIAANHKNLQRGTDSGDSQMQMEAQHIYSDYLHGTTSRQPQVHTHNRLEAVGSKPQRRSPQIKQSSGWFSGRTSMESSRAAYVNGSTAQKKPTAVLQPREAVVGRKGENDELVAFLRSTGPAGVDVYRGPDRLPADSNTTSSANRTSSSNAQSTHGSTNSHTGLLAANMPRSHGSRNMPAMVQDEESGPPRTRRRIKDPYALPSDDENEDGLTALPSNKGETLVDFLKNVEPPSVSNGNLAKTRAPPGGLSELHDLKYQSGGSSPTSPNSPQGRGPKGKGNMKSFLKQIGA